MRRAIAGRRRSRRRCTSPARRPVPPDVHLRHHRPAERRDAHLRQFLLEVRRPRRRPRLDARRIGCSSPGRSIMSAPSICRAWPCCWVGGTICIHRDFDPAAALPLDREGAAHRRLACAGHAERDPRAFRARQAIDVSSIEWVLGGGERTPEPRIRAFADYFTKARYIDAYGLTESCSGDTMMEAGREIEKIGSVGPRAAACRGRDPRRDGAHAAGRRDRRDLPARPEDHARLLEGSGEERGQLLSAAGSAPATSATSTPRASSISPTARRT